MQMKLQVVEDRPVDLFGSWKALAAGGFHDDLVLRARRFAIYGEDHRCGDAMAAVLDMLGNGFLNRFIPADHYDITDNDPHAGIKRGCLTALEQLSAEFGDRVSGVVWHSLATLACREDPLRETTILSIGNHLPYPWWMVDAVLHGLGKVYGLKMHIDSRIYHESGMMLEHNCDCNHALKPVLNNGGILNFLPPDRWQEATAALFTHIASEALMMLTMQLPFALGISPESREVLALEGSLA